MIEADDRIDLLFEAAMWVFRSPQLYIGIYNKHPAGETIDISIQMRQFHSKNLLQPQLRKNIDLFDKIHEERDAHEMSN